MAYGAVIYGNNGMLASADYPGYILHEHVTAYTQLSNNIKRFTTSIPMAVPNPPLVFIKPNPGVAAGLVAVAPPASIVNGLITYTIDVLCDGVVSILVFREIDGYSASGFGMAFFSKSHKLTFDTGKKMLSARTVDVLFEGRSVPTTGDAFNFNAFDLKTVTSDTYHMVSCWSGSFSINYSQPAPLTFVQIAEPTYGLTLKCYLQQGGQQSYNISWTLHAYVTATNWVSYRGCAFFNPDGSLGFRWVQNGAGDYYKVNGWYQYVNVSAPAIGFSSVTNFESYTYSIPWQAWNALGQWVGPTGIIGGSAFPYYSGTYGSNSQKIAVVNSQFYLV